MSAGLGEAVSALGIVSFGIQLCDGILSYYHSAKDYEKDIKASYDCVADLYMTFVVLQQTLSHPQLDPARVKRASNSLRRCAESLSQLQSELLKLKTYSSPSTLQQKAWTSVQRSLYPFREDTIRKLRVKAAELQGHLSLALQVLQLHHIAKEFHKIQTQICQTQNSLAGISTIERDVIGIRQVALASQASLSTIDPRLSNLENLAASSASAVHGVAATLAQINQKLDSLPFRDQSSLNHSTGSHPDDGFVASLQQGSMDLRGEMASILNGRLDVQLYRVCEGVLRDYNQALIDMSPAQFRGWITENAQPTLEKSVQSMLTEAQAEWTNSQNSEVNRSGYLPRRLDQEDNSARLVSRLAHESQVDLTTTAASTGQHFSDQICDTFITSRRNRLCIITLRLARGLKNTYVHLTMHPKTILSNGCDLSYEVSFDSRGFPSFRDGSFDIYGIVPDDDPVIRLIHDENIAGLELALANKTLSLSDRCASGKTLLHIAAECGHLDVCKKLLVWGANFHQLDTYGRTPLESMIFHFTLNTLRTSGTMQIWKELGLPMVHHFQAYQKFDELGVDVSLLLTLLCVCKTFKDLELGTMLSAMFWLIDLRKAGLDLNERDQHGHTSLLRVLLYRHPYQNLEDLDNRITWILLYVLSGADPACCDEYGHSLLHLFFEFWCELRVANNAISDDMQRWHQAMDVLCDGLVILIRLGCDVDAEDRQGHTISHYLDKVAFPEVLQAIFWYCEVEDAEQRLRTRQHAQVSSVERPSCGNDIANNLRRRAPLHSGEHNIKLSETCKISQNRPESACPYELPEVLSLYRHRNCPFTCRAAIRRNAKHHDRISVLNLYLSWTGRNKGQQTSCWTGFLWTWIGDQLT